MQENEDILREKMKEIASEHIEKGDFYGWFDKIYCETEENSELIPWVDLEPNRFLLEWNKIAKLKGDRRKALVIGCGLGDEAKFLDELNFDVTAFDVSEKAIEIAKKLHAETEIKFYCVDLFNSPNDWQQNFDFVLEVYTIQALPLALREKTIDAIGNFVAKKGELIVVQRFRENDEDAGGLPWALSPNDLARFEKNGLKQTSFNKYLGEEDEPFERFVAVYNLRS